ncbi:MAG: hypothetical protein KGJ82_02100 [Nitrospirota bacterium]|nr:hypothetical protein [Nitrospirota bacterium]
MCCPRCGGLMLLVRYEDWGSTTTSKTFLAWDCAQCGAVIDPVILANRAKRPAPIKNRARVPAVV